MILILIPHLACVFRIHPVTITKTQTKPKQIKSNRVGLRSAWRDCINHTIVGEWSQQTLQLEYDCHYPTYIIIIYLRVQPLNKPLHWQCEYENDITSNNARFSPQHEQNFSVKFHDDKVFWHNSGKAKNSHFVIRKDQNNFQSMRNAYAVCCSTTIWVSLWNVSQWNWKNQLNKRLWTMCHSQRAFWHTNTHLK